MRLVSDGKTAVVGVHARRNLRHSSIRIHRLPHAVADGRVTVTARTRTTPTTGHPDRLIRQWQDASYQRALEANPAMRYLRYDAPPEVDAARAVALLGEA